MSLAGYSPSRFLNFKWMFSWEEILDFYKRKIKDQIEKSVSDREFLIELATAALGGKKKDDEFGLADCSEIELTDEQIASLKQTLGENFKDVYPQYAD